MLPPLPFLDLYDMPTLYVKVCGNGLANQIDTVTVQDLGKLMQLIRLARVQPI